MAVVGGALAGSVCAADALQVELAELQCRYARTSAKIQDGALEVSMPPCVVSLCVRAGAADSLLCGVQSTEWTATDAKGNRIKVTEIQMPMLGASDKEKEAAQKLMLQLAKLPKGGSVTISGSLTARVANGANTAEPQAFDAKKGGSFTAGSVSYTLAAGKAMDFMGFGGSEGCTAVEMKASDADAIANVTFTTAEGKAVKITGKASMFNVVTYTLDTKETALRIAVSTYKEVQEVSCPVNMTLNLSGEVKKKAAEGADNEQPKPKQKKTKKK